MSISSLIKKEHVILPLQGKTKTEVILELIGALKNSGAINDEQAVYQAVMEREALSTTGLSSGFAVPHAKTAAVSAMALAVGISSEGIDFNSIDGELSHFFFLMVAPANQPGQHIAMLAEIAKLSQLPAFSRFLKKATSVEDVIDLLE